MKVSRDTAYTSYSSLALFPSDGNHRARNDIDASLRSKKVELGSGVSGIQHLNTDAERAEVLPRRRAKGHNLGTNTDDEKICKEASLVNWTTFEIEEKSRMRTGPRPDQIKEPECFRRQLELALGVDQVLGPLRLPGPPLECLAADEQRRIAVHDLDTAVQVEAVPYAGVDRGRGDRRIGQYVHLAEVGRSLVILDLLIL